MPRPLALVVLTFSFVACEGGDASCGTALQPFTPAPARTSTEAPSLLSAYHGLDELPAPARRLCGSGDAVGQDGIPLVFSAPLDEATVTAEAFQVTTAAGPVAAVCATLRPAVEPWEGHTVLLAGPSGPRTSRPTRWRWWAMCGLSVGRRRGVFGPPTSPRWKRGRGW